MILGWRSLEFETFWKLYPQKEAKHTSIKAWKKLRPTEEEIVKIMQQLSLDKDSLAWRNGVGIPFANAWLLHRPWIK